MAQLLLTKNSKRTCSMLMIHLSKRRAKEMYNGILGNARMASHTVSDAKSPEATFMRDSLRTEKKTAGAD